MIYDVDQIDLLGKRKDGGIDLFIISSGGIDVSAETQNLLLDKVGKYLGYINSEDFKKEYPDILKDKVSIVLEFDEQPPELLLELCKKIVPWASDNGAIFVTRVKKR